MKIAFAGRSESGCSERRLTSRPPETRISFVGHTNRKRQSTFRQRRGSSSSNALQRRPVDRVQEVDGNRVGVELAQGERDVDELLVRLAHAGDHAGARRDPRALDRLEGRHAVLVGVCRRDPAVVVGARVEVVVVAVDSGLSEGRCLLVGQEPEAGADLHRQLGLDPAHRCRHARAARARSAPGRSRRCSTSRPSARHASRAPSRMTSSSRSEYFGIAAVGHDRLGAVAAVLRADAALRVHQQVELHLLAEGRPADSIGGTEQRQQLLVRGAQDGERLGTRRRLAAQRPGRPAPPSPVSGGLSEPCQARRTSSRPSAAKSGPSSSRSATSSESASPFSSNHGTTASTGTSP